MVKEFFNDKGIRLVGYTGPKVKKMDFYIIAVDGTQKLNYPPDDGFDKDNNEPNGSYKMKVKLKRGVKIIRYGSEMGSFTAPKGSEYSLLALPWVQDSVEYHEYEVIADGITVVCQVWRGKVAPAFDSPGGAVQYKHEENIAAEIKHGKLRRIK